MNSSFSHHRARRRVLAVAVILGVGSMSALAEPIVNHARTASVSTEALGANAASTSGFEMRLLARSVVGGNSVMAEVRLDTAAPTGGATVPLKSNAPGVTVPATLDVPAGAKTAQFAISTHAVASVVGATITATDGHQVRQALLTVRPAILSSVAIMPRHLHGGASGKGVLLLTGDAPEGGMVVSITGDKNAHVSKKVLVPAGQHTAEFSVTPAAVTSPTAARITATSGPVRRSVDFLIER